MLTQYCVLRTALGSGAYASSLKRTLNPRQGAHRLLGIALRDLHDLIDAILVEDGWKILLRPPPDACTSHQPPPLCQSALKTLRKILSQTLSKTLSKTLRRTLIKALRKTLRETFGKTFSQTLSQTLRKTLSQTLSKTSARSPFRRVP